MINVFGGAERDASDKDFRFLFFTRGFVKLQFQPLLFKQDGPFIIIWVNGIFHSPKVTSVLSIVSKQLLFPEKMFERRQFHASNQSHRWWPIIPNIGFVQLISVCWSSVGWSVTFLKIRIYLSALHLNLQFHQFMFDLIAPYIPPRSLRSSSKNLLIVPDFRSEMGHRSFSFAAPTIWNSLPQHIRSSDSLSVFRGLLKTFLYQKSLPP